MAVLIESFNRIAETAVVAEQVFAEAEASGKSYFATWIEDALGQAASSSKAGLLTLVAPLATEISLAKDVIEKVLQEIAKSIEGLDADSDVVEDFAAWNEISRDIARHVGKTAPLDQFIQELQLRSKEPTRKPDSVGLMTIHGAKGGEFDHVFVIGLAEDIMPSFQSRQKGDKSPEMEEERRNCFVAITRARESLILSRAERYRGWQKEPSRFLVEMELAN